LIERLIRRCVGLSTPIRPPGARIRAQIRVSGVGQRLGREARPRLQVASSRSTLPIVDTQRQFRRLERLAREQKEKERHRLLQ
jgi:hypothetical protein